MQTNQYKINKYKDKLVSTYDKHKMIIYCKKLDYYLHTGGGGGDGDDWWDEPEPPRPVPIIKPDIITDKIARIVTQLNKIQPNQFNMSLSKDIGESIKDFNSFFHRKDVVVDFDNMSELKSFTVDLYAPNWTKKDVKLIFDSGEYVLSFKINSKIGSMMPETKKYELARSKDFPRPSQVNPIVVLKYKHGDEMLCHILTSGKDDDTIIDEDAKCGINNSGMYMDDFWKTSDISIRKKLVQIYNSKKQKFDILIGLPQIIKLANYGIYPIIKGQAIAKFPIPFHNFSNTRDGLRISFDTLDESVRLVIDTAWYEPFDIDIYWEHPSITALKKILDDNHLIEYFGSDNRCFIIKSIFIHYNKLKIKVENILGINRKFAMGFDTGKIMKDHPILLTYNCLHKLYNAGIYPSGMEEQKHQ